MESDIVARLRDFCGWKFQVPECGHHQNKGNTRAPIFVPEHISDTGEWIPVLIETGYSDGLRYYMFSPKFMLRQAADEIERLREALRIEQEELAACFIDRRETQRERDEARAEIERLRAEIVKLREALDAARIEVCLVRAPSTTATDDTEHAMREYAKGRGWDCFRGMSDEP